MSTAFEGRTKGAGPTLGAQGSVASIVHTNCILLYCMGGAWDISWAELFGATRHMVERIGLGSIGSGCMAMHIDAVFGWLFFCH